MRDGAIVHLTEDGTQKHEVPGWPCDYACAHSNLSKREDMFFCDKLFWNIRGVTFHWRLTIEPSIVHWTVPWHCEQSKYSFKYFPLLLFQILLRAHAQENQKGTPFWVSALLPFHTRQEQPDDHVGLDLTPVMIF